MLNGKHKPTTVLAPPKLPKGKLIDNRPSRLALMEGSVHAGIQGEREAKESQSSKRARLMLLAKCSVHVVTRAQTRYDLQQLGGGFMIIDPLNLSPEDRAETKFTEKTLVILEEDIDKAIAHFEAEARDKAN